MRSISYDMLLEKVRSEGLSALSYIVGSGNEAIVIDPRRDIDEYLDTLSSEGMALRYVLETHRHEDFASGASGLAEVTGAEVLHGPGIEWGHGTTVADGQRFRVGSLAIKAIHTPGHTHESMCYLLSEADGPPFVTFTGDTLFVGEVGRTDMYGPEMTERMSEALYDSLWERVMGIEDCVIVMPAHGAGSVCGKRISDREMSTIGFERRNNPMLQLDRDAFIRAKCEERHPFSNHFIHMEEMNVSGRPVMTRLPDPRPMGPGEFESELERSVVIDTRSPPCFGGAHIPGSLNILKSGMPMFTGHIVERGSRILLVVDSTRDVELCVRYLVRIGYDDVVGYLKGGMQSWYGSARDVGHMGVLTVQELSKMLDSDDPPLLIDVRPADEYAEGHIEGAVNMLCGDMDVEHTTVPRDQRVVTICGIGNRGNLAASVLLREGLRDVHNVLGGMSAWSRMGQEYGIND